MSFKLPKLFDVWVFTIIIWIQVQKIFTFLRKSRLKNIRIQINIYTKNSFISKSQRKLANALTIVISLSL